MDKNLKSPFIAPTLVEEASLIGVTLVTNGGGGEPCTNVVVVCGH